jgi:AcrR family transcriptional regulator
MGKVAERRARTIDAIVAAAVDVMGETGAAGLSLGEVARRVGMRTPSLYGYFASRSALCVAGAGLSPDTDVVAFLSDLLTAAVDWANSHRAHAELMFWRPIPHWQPSPEAFEPAIEVLADAIASFARAKDLGLLRHDVDVDEVAQAWAVLVAGVISQQLSNEPGVAAADGRASRHAAALAAMFVAHYGRQSREDNP